MGVEVVGVEVVGKSGWVSGVMCVFVCMHVCEPSLLLSLPPPGSRLREADTRPSADDISAQTLVMRLICLDSGN